MANNKYIVYILSSKYFGPTSWLPGNASHSINMSLIICQFALLMTETVIIKTNFKKFLK